MFVRSNINEKKNFALHSGETRVVVIIVAIVTFSSPTLYFHLCQMCGKVLNGAIRNISVSTKKKLLSIYFCFVQWLFVFVQENGDNHKAASAISYITPFVYSQNRKYNFPCGTACICISELQTHENGPGNCHRCNPNVQASFSDFPHIINREKYDRGSPAANIRRKIK